MGNFDKEDFVELACLIVFVVAGIWLIQVKQHSLERHKTTDYAPTQGQLIDAFRDYNDLYFYGNLPVSKTRIYLKNIDDFDDMGNIIHAEDGTYIITIDPRIHAVEKQAEMTELHEMCHEEDMINEENEGMDGHSYAFEACMESVAKRGGFRHLW